MLCSVLVLVRVQAQDENTFYMTVDAGIGQDVRLDGLESVFSENETVTTLCVRVNNVSPGFSVDLLLNRTLLTEQPPPSVGENATGTWGASIFVESGYDNSLLYADSPWMLLMLGDRETEGDWPEYSPNRNVLALDEDALWSRRRYAFVGENESDAAVWKVRAENRNMVSAQLNQMDVLVRITFDRASACPVGPQLYSMFESRGLASNVLTTGPTLCSGQGTCSVNGTCLCTPPYTGWACEAFAELTPFWTYENDRVNPNFWQRQVGGDQYDYFSYAVTRPGNVAAYILPNWDFAENAKDYSTPILIAKQPFENGGLHSEYPQNASTSGEFLPTFGDVAFQDVLGVDTQSYIQFVTSYNMRAGDTILIAVFNQLKTDRRVTAQYNLTVLNCGQPGEIGCPARVPNSFPLGYVLLPLLFTGLIVLSVTTTVFIVNRRRNMRAGPGGASSMAQPRPKKMSHDEINQLFPSYVYDPERERADFAQSRGVLPDPECGHSVAGTESEPQCCICLCNFEGGEMMRDLPCAHRFHAECLDPWIAGHRSCPFCRAQFEVTTDASLISRFYCAIRGTAVPETVTAVGERESNEAGRESAEQYRELPQEARSAASPVGASSSSDYHAGDRLLSADAVENSSNTHTRTVSV
ncbi:E3 ubiquitin-protein ligase RNF38 [Porphyridium purpureum]|uniref:E3 ubiquitin-protein ligase RNF38 n=1 Tax=Porphyridium purpureum TaxID=35688 RepID=A0A5J4Z148_PORPP|nr:E3 ubiquitin-protein ligase RNF38 [Porphyridium purpureum]|eukprot:POR1844..scf208_2